MPNSKPSLSVPYCVEHRNVKHARLELKTGTLVIILPLGETDEHRVIEKYADWIASKNIEINNSVSRASKMRDNNILDEKEFRHEVAKIARKQGEALQGKLNKIFFRSMNSKWASCSANKNLTINLLARHLPPRLIRYIVVHEMAHLKEKRHNELFWSIVRETVPDCDRAEKELSAYWFKLQQS